ncbi:MAG TPA: response regulator [Planctomycetota bacterium]|nr:response regulator [Planctomycetota bacterium]
MKPLTALLEQRGIRVLLATSTREALARAKEASPDIVVVDGDLEPIGTSSFLDALRSCSLPPGIILISGDLTDPGDEVDRSLGLLHHAVKPVDACRVFDVISSELNRKSRSAEAPKNRHALILCVDDDSLYLSSLSRTLTRHGYRVFLCTSAARALASLPDVRPDLAIVDIMMPGTDGLSLTESIRTWSNGRIPVVLLTALASDEAYHEGYARGAQRFLSKPCPPDVVLREVDSLLEASASGGAAG